MLIDTHCHLFYDDLKNDLLGVLDRAHDLGVNRFICVATNMEDARECLLMGESHENIFASAGVHPHDAKDAPEDFVDQIYNIIIRVTIVKNDRFFQILGNTHLGSKNIFWISGSEIFLK